MQGCLIAVTCIRDKAIILTLFQSGISINELCNLTCGDVRNELQNNERPLYLHIIRPKGNVEYETFLGTEAIEAIKSYLAQRVRDGETLNVESPLFRIEFTTRAKGNKIKKIYPLLIECFMRRAAFEAGLAMFDGTANFIRRFNQPILGICFGHQLLCWTLGATVDSFNQPVGKFEKINVIAGKKLFDGFTQPILAENQHDFVLKERLDKAGFALLADSPSFEVEAVKHRAKPFYGVQFHPERLKLRDEPHADGHTIIENFNNNVVKNVEGLFVISSWI